MTNFERMQARLFDKSFTLKEAAETLGIAQQSARNCVILRPSLFLKGKIQTKGIYSAIYAFKDSPKGCADFMRRVAGESATKIEILKAYGRAFTQKHAGFLCHTAPSNIATFLNTDAFVCKYGQMKDKLGRPAVWYAPAEFPERLDEIEPADARSNEERAKKLREKIKGRAVTRKELAELIGVKDSKIITSVVNLAGVKTFYSPTLNGFAVNRVFALPEDEEIAQARLEELFNEWLEKYDDEEELDGQTVPASETTLEPQLFGEVLERYQEVKTQKKREFRRYKSLSNVERLGRALGRNWRR